MSNVTVCLYCMIRSKMGFLESGSIYLHKMCRHPQEPGSTHIQSQVCQPGPMDLRTNPGSVYTRVHFGSSSKEELRHLGVQSGSVQPHGDIWHHGRFIAEFSGPGHLSVRDPNFSVGQALNILVTTLLIMQTVSCMHVIRNHF